MWFVCIVVVCDISRDIDEAQQAQNSGELKVLRTLRKGPLPAGIVWDLTRFLFSILLY
jgi:hypothetical protein